MNKYEIWLEGFRVTGQSSKASRLTKDNENTLWDGVNFIEACKNALSELKWDMLYYNEKTNSYWGCKFYDNEADARKNFG